MENISTITSLSVDLGSFGGDICMPVEILSSPSEDISTISP
jgi:hypothetical protein